MNDPDKCQELPEHYSIQVQGAISESWKDWLGEMRIVPEATHASLTTLTGPVADQAALRGLLIRIWDLNLTLISVARLRPAQQTEARTAVKEVE